MHSGTAERRHVWLARSDMFLDTDAALSRAWRVSELAGWTVRRWPEWQAILQGVRAHR